MAAPEVMRARAARLRPNSVAAAGYRGRPLAFLLHYVAGIRSAMRSCCSVLLAVMAAVSTQYGMKHLIDVIVRAGPARPARASGGPSRCCAALVAADNLLWRVGG